MNTKRASEIASSLNMVDVSYNGTAIYIETVNKNKETASIHSLDRPEYSQEVSLTQLQELK